MREGKRNGKKEEKSEKRLLTFMKPVDENALIHPNIAITTIVPIAG